MDIDGKSLNIVQDNLARLKQLFPNLVKEGEIDLNELKATFGQEPNISDERYGLSWAGKYDSFRQVQAQTSYTLLPDRANSLAFDRTQNIFIEGENLDVLKILQKSYYGQIKMIYIDPPYNTGNDHFIYPDKYAESKEEYLQRAGATDEQGYLNKADLFRKNSRENGHFHSVWLSMMYPRLYLARNLLREDGVIFVSIDDNEVANLRLLMDEVFGEENFIAQVSILTNPKGRSQDRHFSKSHEYLIIYSKNYLESELSIPKSKQEILADYPEEDDTGKYRLLELRNTHREFGKFNRPNLWYPFYVETKTLDISLDSRIGYTEVYPNWNDGFEGCWTWGKPKAEQKIAKLVAKQVNEVWKIYRKDYASNEEGQVATKQLKTIWSDKEYITERGQREFDELFNIRKLFAFPKPIGLLKRIIQLITDQQDIVLDFFAGSNSLAHAVFDLNKEDGGNRKFICVQLPEKTPEGSPARNAGYGTIADIGRARIRKVIEQMNAAQAAQLPFDEKPVLGFRSFTLAASNFKIWRGDLEDMEDVLDQLELFQQPVRTNHTEAILWELLLKAGYPLSARVEPRQIEGVTIYFIDGGQMIIALQAVNQTVVNAARQAKPHVFICLDSLFNNDDQLKTNTSLQFQDEGIIFKAI